MLILLVGVVSLRALLLKLCVLCVLLVPCELLILSLSVGVVRTWLRVVRCTGGIRLIGKNLRPRRLKIPQKVECGVWHGVLNWQSDRMWKHDIRHNGRMRVWNGWNGSRKRGDDLRMVHISEDVVAAGVQFRMQRHYRMQDLSGLPLGAVFGSESQADETESHCNLQKIHFILKHTCYKFLNTDTLWQPNG